MSLPPFNYITLTPSRGELIATAKTFESFFAPFAAIFTYGNTLTGTSLIPLFLTSPTRSEHAQVVGGVVREGKGAIVFCPTVRDWKDANIVAFFEATAGLPGLLGPVQEVIPAWTQAFHSTAEAAATKRLVEIDDQITALRVDRDAEDSVISKEKMLKVLYCGNDEALVAAVERALRELDLKVIRGPHPRADLLIWDGRTGLAAAEVKGLDGESRERNLSQALRWAAEVNSTLTSAPEERAVDPDLKRYAECLAALGLDLSAPVATLDCRGLMIIGTYRQTPLDQRPAHSFSVDLVRKIQRADVCALTGLDLYCLVQKIRVDPTVKASAAEKLFTYNGVLPPEDWRDVIST